MQTVWMRADVLRLWHMQLHHGFIIAKEQVAHVLHFGPVGTAVGPKTKLNTDYGLKALSVYTPPGSPAITAFQTNIPLGTRAPGVIRTANTLQAVETRAGSRRYTLVNNFQVNQRVGKTGGGVRVLARGLSLRAARARAEDVVKNGSVDENGQIFP